MEKLSLFSYHVDFNLHLAFLKVHTKLIVKEMLGSFFHHLINSDGYTLACNIFNAAHIVKCLKVTFELKDLD